MNKNFFIGFGAVVATIILALLFFFGGIFLFGELWIIIVFALFFIVSIGALNYEELCSLGASIKELIKKDEDKM